MASRPIISWQTGKKAEAVTNFIFLGSKIIVDCDCSREIKRRLFLGRIVMTNLDSILKNRVIPWPTEVHIVKTMIFPVVMYACESWTIKKAECQRTDAFELWCWRRLLRVLWTARRSNQSVLKKSTLDIHWKDWCWSWSFNTLAIDVKSWLLGKDPDAGKDWRQKEKGATEDEMASNITESMDVNLSKLQQTEEPGVWQFIESQSWTGLSEWTTKMS